MTTLALVPETAYSRKDLFVLLELPGDTKGGNWFTGYQSYKGEHFIFANVGVPGRTGHDYDNKWVADDQFRWFGKTNSTREQPQISAMLSGNEPVLLFWREDDRNTSFIFAGRVKALSATGGKPVEVLWQIDPADAEVDTELAEEVHPDSHQREGATKQMLVNRYERSQSARRVCVEHYKPICAVCEFDFAAVYGCRGDGFIHVHHLVPLAEVGESYEVDPITDLRPVCPNCHEMIHRYSPPLTIEALKELMA